MVLIIGGIFSGRHEYAKKIVDSDSIYSITDSDLIDFENENTNFELSRVVEKITSFPVVIATEIGCGIVPLSENERKIRELNGQLNQFLAKNSKNVILLTAGIPQFIKKTVSTDFFTPRFMMIFRHGQTEANIQKRFAGGLTDSKLTNFGLEKIKEMKNKMPIIFENYQSDIKKQILNPKRIFVSPMFRAIKTAQTLFPNAKLEIIEDFREIKMGLFENMSHEELVNGRFADGSVSQENKEFYQNWIDSNAKVAPPSSSDFVGESKENFVNRCKNAFEEILQNLEENELPIIVAHGGVQMALCKSFFIKKANFSYLWQTENASFRFGEIK